MSDKSTPGTNADETIDVEGMAELLHCSVDQAEELCKAGELPAVKFGRGWIAVRDDLLATVRDRARAEAEHRRGQRRPAPAGAGAPAPRARRRAHPQLSAV